MYCSSKKEVQPFVQRLEWIARGEQSRGAMKTHEIRSILQEYCKVGANKYIQGSHLRNALSVLESMVENPTE